MARSHGFLYNAAFYIFGLFNYCLYIALAMRSGAFFKRPTEQDKLQLAIGGTGSFPLVQHR